MIGDDLARARIADRDTNGASKVVLGIPGTKYEVSPSLGAREAGRIMWFAEHGNVLPIVFLSTRSAVASSRSTLGGIGRKSARRPDPPSGPSTPRRARP